VGCGGGWIFRGLVEGGLFYDIVFVILFFYMILFWNRIIVTFFGYFEDQISQFFVFFSVIKVFFHV